MVAFQVWYVDNILLVGNGMLSLIEIWSFGTFSMKDLGEATSWAFASIEIE